MCLTSIAKANVSRTSQSPGRLFWRALPESAELELVKVGHPASSSLLLDGPAPAPPQPLGVSLSGFERNRWLVVVGAGSVVPSSFLGVSFDFDN